jgi:hypothetical protein
MWREISAIKSNEKCKLCHLALSTNETSSRVGLLALDLEIFDLSTFG